MQPESPNLEPPPPCPPPSFLPLFITIRIFYSSWSLGLPQSSWVACCQSQRMVSRLIYSSINNLAVIRGGGQDGWGGGSHCSGSAAGSSFIMCFPPPPCLRLSRPGDLRIHPLAAYISCEEGEGFKERGEVFLGGVCVCVCEYTVNQGFCSGFLPGNYPAK